MAAYGKLGRFLEFPVTGSNEPSAASLARAGVREQLGPLQRQVRETRKRCIAPGVDVVTEFGLLKTDIICDPLEDDALLFVFRETGQFTPLLDGELMELEPGDSHVEALEGELRSARHRLRSATEELETANEELKSSNEEMMSMNEELQSTNEELTTVNDELKTKIEQLTVANADLRNFFESTNLAVIVLDKDMRIRLFTRAATEVFALRPTDRGRPLSDLSSQFLNVDYVERARSVMSAGADYHGTVIDSAHARTFTLRILPYRTSDGAVDGATIVLTDISHALNIEGQLASEQERHALAIEASGIGVWEYLPGTKQFVIAGSAKRLLGTADERPSLEEFLQKLSDAERERMEAALKTADEAQTGFELTTKIALPGGGSRWVKTFARYVTDSSPSRIIGVSVDVTAEHQLVEARELMLNEMSHRVKNLFALIGGILRIAARKHENASALVEDVGGRILALGRAHSLTSDQKRRHATELSELVEIILEPYRRQSDLVISSRSLAIPANCVTPLTLILHEWCTNAVKHGVLGQVDGRLEVSWENLGNILQLVWNEMGAKPVSAHGDAGFGTILLSTSAKQINATIKTDIDGAVLRHTLTMPLPMYNNA